MKWYWQLYWWNSWLRWLMNSDETWNRTIMIVMNYEEWFLHCSSWWMSEYIITVEYNCWKIESYWWYSWEWTQLDMLLIVIWIRRIMMHCCKEWIITSTHLMIREIESEDAWWWYGELRNYWVELFMLMEW